jgi:undecaprenyl-diphosphatase
MRWNAELFALLNAPAAPAPALVLVMRLLAGSPLLVAPALLVWLWVRAPGPRRAGLLAVALAALVGQGANMGLGLLWFEPRPFMAGIGHTLLVHAPDNGFPSDHTTLMFTLASGLVFTAAAPAWGVAMAVLGLGVGWARIWLGVHFPVDVLTGMLVGTAAGWLAGVLVPSLRRHLLVPLECLYEFLLGALHLPAVLFPRRPR